MSDLAWSVIVPLALAIFGLIAWLIKQWISRTERRMDEHIRDDIQAHERLKGVETEVDNLKVEVGKLRDMRHDIIEQVTHSLASWYTNIMKEIGKWK